MADIVEYVDTKSIVVRLKMPRAFGLRMSLTTTLLRLVGVVSPVTIDIEIA